MTPRLPPRCRARQRLHTYYLADWRPLIIPNLESCAPGAPEFLPSGYFRPAIYPHVALGGESAKAIGEPF